MITDHRLHDGQPQPRSLQLGCVIRREQPGALFRSQAFARVGHFDAHIAILFQSSESQGPPGRHGVQRIQHQILKRAVEQVGVRVDIRQGFGQEQLRCNGGLADFVELRLEETHRIAQRLIHIHVHKLWRGHF